MYTKVTIAWKDFVNLLENTQLKKLILKRKKMSLSKKEHRNHKKMQKFVNL